MPESFRAKHSTWINGKKTLHTILVRQLIKVVGEFNDNSRNRFNIIILPSFEISEAGIFLTIPMGYFRSKKHDWIVEEEFEKDRRKIEDEMQKSLSKKLKFPAYQIFVKVDIPSDDSYKFD